MGWLSRLFAAKKEPDAARKAVAEGAVAEIEANGSLRRAEPVP
jgi:hypothetical protein